jgi:hypothetical protein
MRRKHNVAPTTNAKRDEVLLDHIINLTDQVRRLADALRAAGIAVPGDIGTLGPASVELVERYTREALERDFPDRPIPREGGP